MTVRSLSSLACSLALVACGGGHHGGGGDVVPGGTVVVAPSTIGQRGVTAFRTADSTGSTTFVTGPATPPAGDGSVQFAVGANGDGAEELRFNVLDGTALTQITQLTYWTYVQSGGGQQAPYLILRVDWNGDGTQDDLLFFEPAYQHGFTTDVPDQGALVTGLWQPWDARNGGWWSLDDPAFPAGAGVDTLAAYTTAHPGASILAGGSQGALRLVAGYGAPAWNGFVGNADDLVVGDGAVVTTYDFEPTP